MVPCGLVGAAISLLLGKPHLVVEHSGALHLLKQHSLGHIIARFVVRYSRRVVTVTNDLREKLIACCPDAGSKTDVLSMGFNCGAVRPHASQERPGATPTVLFIGRLSAIKGVDVAIEAVSLLEQAGQPVKLLIAGEGKERTRMEAAARRLGINAEFAGRVNARERERLLAHADIVVVPSIVLPGGRTEGLPVACLEAMAAGRPVIASRTGGLAEIIVDGENGLLSEPGDPVMLAERLQLLLSTQELRSRITESARLAAEQCHWEIMGPRFADLIGGILEGRA
jgi:glycosyltransferase involved in cell wall biosynthesis